MLLLHTRWLCAYKCRVHCSCKWPRTLSPRRRSRSCHGDGSRLRPAGSAALLPAAVVTFALGARRLAAAKHSLAVLIAWSAQAACVRRTYCPSRTLRRRVVTGHSSSPLYVASGPSVGAREVPAPGTLTLRRRGRKCFQSVLWHQNQVIALKV